MDETKAKTVKEALANAVGYVIDPGDFDADALEACVIQYFEDAGYVILPKEPTPEMLSRGAFYFIQGGGGATKVDCDLAKAAYKAMVKRWTDDHS